MNIFSEDFKLFSIISFFIGYSICVYYFNRKFINYLKCKFPNNWETLWPPKYRPKITMFRGPGTFQISTITSLMNKQIVESLGDKKLIKYYRILNIIDSMFFIIVLLYIILDIILWALGKIC